MGNKVGKLLMDYLFIYLIYPNPKCWLHPASIYDIENNEWANGDNLGQVCFNEKCFLKNIFPIFWYYLIRPKIVIKPNIFSVDQKKSFNFR
jgi:hypothetical protein